MSFGTVKIIDPYVEIGMTQELKLTLAVTAEVEALETELNAYLPVGYREYVTTFGLGAYCNLKNINSF
jgi:hypothetical protein